LNQARRCRNKNDIKNNVENNIEKKHYRFYKAGSSYRENFRVRVNYNYNLKGRWIMNENNFTRRKMTGIVAAASLMSFSGSVSWAQSSTRAALEEVIVTAQKREQNMQDVPIAITTYSAYELEAKGLTSIIDLEKSSPNTQMRASRGTNSTLTAFVRGAGQQDPLWGFEPGVGVYVDDVYIARPQGAVLDVFDVERIELLRGPQGTLYGKNTIGGALKYITKRMSGEATAKITTAIGAYGQEDISLSGQLPIIDNQLYIGAAVSSLTRDGFGKQYKDYDSATGSFGRTEENYNKDVLTGRISVEYTPIDALSLRFAADKTDDDSNNRCGSRFAANTVAGPNGEFFGPLGSVYDSQCGMTEKSNVESEGISLTAQYDLTDSLSLKYIYADREGNTETYIDFDGTPLDSFEVPAFYKDDQQTHEIQANYTGERFAVVGGLYYYEGNAAGAFDALFGQFSTGVLTGSQFSNSVFGDVDTESTSLYMNANFDVTPTVTLTAGVRVTRDEKAASINRQFIVTSNSFPGSTNQGTGVTFGDPADDTVTAIRTNFSKDDTNDEWTETSPTLKADWKVTDDFMLYVSWAAGFKSGGFDMRTDAAVEPNAVEGYDPETVDTYELGLKGQFFDDRFRVNLTLFQSDFTDMQVTVQAPAPAPALFSSTVVNAGEAEIRGFELETITQFTENFSATFAVGHLNAEFITVDDAVLGNVANPQPDPSRDGGLDDGYQRWEMQNAPDWTGQLGLNYNANLGDAGSFALSTTVSFRDASRNFNEITTLSDQDSAYALWDASVVWYSADEHWTAAVHLKNLGNKTYNTGGYNFLATAGEDAVLGFYGPPRTWTASLAYEF
jgi:iron complex outermembrane recepter protein